MILPLFQRMAHRFLTRPNPQIRQTIYLIPVAVGVIPNTILLLATTQAVMAQLMLSKIQQAIAPASPSKISSRCSTTPNTATSWPYLNSTKDTS